MEAGETVVAAARREIAEETGFSQVDFGEELWRDENLVSDRRGRPVLVKDVFILARCAGGEPDRSGWQARERAFIDDIRWWDLDDLAAQTEPTWPPDLAARLIAVRRARAPGSATE
jgi:ADP-ribose pyrophosphatase YjhB (NUDIX family)